MQTGAVRGAGPRGTFPLRIAPLPSEGLGKAPPASPGCGDPQLLHQREQEGTGPTPSAPSPGAETPVQGAQYGNGPGLGGLCR